jgi:hypothetical protein
MRELAERLAPVPCPACGTELAPALLACPNCHRLVHGEQLKQFAAQAEQAERDQDLTAALVAWREALALLPSRARQHEIIAQKIHDLGKRVDASPANASQPKSQSAALEKGHGWTGAGGAAGLGGIALLIWKFKFLAVLILTKGKFLLLGITKASTFLSMFVPSMSCSSPLCRP